jgi:glycogen debranching enzyme
MAALARRLGCDREDADTWSDEAAALRARFHAKFWDDERKMIVLALDGGGRPCRVLASNQGHCLWTEILDADKARHVAAHLLSPAMFTGHGIRTLALGEKAYNPLSYHNGSVWPHDNALIAEGLRRYDCMTELRTLAEGLFDVIERSEDLRIPELFCGFPRHGSERPVPYDVACKPQAWAAGSIFLLLKGMLGLSIDAESGSLLLKTPILPKQVDRLEIRRLILRDKELDVVIRHGSLGGTVEVLRHSGALGHVTILN